MIKLKPFFLCVDIKCEHCKHSFFNRCYDACKKCVNYIIVNQPERLSEKTSKDDTIV